MEPDAATARRRIERGRWLVLSAATLIGASFAWDALERWLGGEGTAPSHGGWGKELVNLAAVLLPCYGLYRGWWLSTCLFRGAFSLLSFAIAIWVGFAITGTLAGDGGGFGIWNGGPSDILRLMGVAYCGWALFLSGDGRSFLRWRRGVGEGTVPAPPRTERWRIGNR